MSLSPFRASLVFVLCLFGLQLSHGATGDAYVTDFFDGTLYKIDSNGARTAVATNLGGPTDETFDTAGNLLVTDSSRGSIYSFSSDGTETIFASGLGGPQGIAVDSSNDVFVTNGSGTIAEFVNGGGRITLPYTFSLLEGLVISNGNLYVSDFNAQKVFQINLTTGLETTYVGPQAFVHDSGPDGLAFDSAGNLYVSTFEGGASSGNNPAAQSVLKFTSSGTETTLATGVYQPGGLRVNNGTVFVTEFGNTGAPGQDVIEIAPNGAQSIFATGLDGPADIAFQSDVTGVPEPASWTVALLTGAVMAFTKRRPRVRLC